MTKSRSPSHPSISLADAIIKASAIYKKEHMSPMTRASAAEAMGYSGISGASLKTLASLRKYNLLEGRGEDVRLTKTAQTLVIDNPSSLEYLDAYKACGMNPEIFGELKRQFGSNGSEKNISIYLEKQGFMPSPASLVARHFKEVTSFIEGNPHVEVNSWSNTGEEFEESTEDSAAQDEDHSSAPKQTSPNIKTTSSIAPFVIIEKQLHIHDCIDLAGLERFKKKLEIYENLLRLENEDDLDQA